MEQQSSSSSSSVAGALADAQQQPPPASVHTRKRSTSGAGGLLSKFSFMRSSGEHHRPRSSRRSTDDKDDAIHTSPPTPSFHTIPAETPPDVASLTAPPPLSHAILQQQTQQQQKTRRRRGSLRKVALLGRGAQREKREARALAVDTKFRPDGKAFGTHVGPPAGPAILTQGSGYIYGPGPGLERGIPPTIIKDEDDDILGLGISDITPRPSMDGYASRSVVPPPSPTPPRDQDVTPTAGSAPVAASSSRGASTTNSAAASPTISYSTTDDEDTLHMVGSSSRPTTPSLSLSSSSISLLRPERASLSSGSESYFPSLPHTHPRPLGMGSSAGGSGALSSIQRRRSTIQRAKSPLALTSLAGLSTTPIPNPDADWDYAETEWWGWVVLVVTWTVFVTGMGSCLGVWSWAWDVGTTPYAPPELEDDPTLPIVGYYPSLIILTAVMAWVWVVVAWVGMKYFRHARVGGD